MQPKKENNIRSRVKSFSYAINGIRLLTKTEPNAKLHLLATVVVIVVGIIRHLGPMQWVAIVFATGLVWITEAVNTAIEQLCDFSCKGEYQQPIKIIKDVSAAAVLFAAVTSVAIAVIVFFF